VDLDKYTLDNYMRIVTYKTAFYSFYLPIACGMLLAGISDPASYKVSDWLPAMLLRLCHICGGSLPQVLLPTMLANLRDAMPEGFGNAAATTNSVCQTPIHPLLPM